MNRKINYSIIIPHYNIPELLDRCIRSIPERDDLQIIVVDDNSPNSDNYKERVISLQRNDVEYYKTPKNSGGGAARNIGIRNVRGRKILFADADDFFVEDINDILNQFVEDPADIIYFNTKGVLSDDVSKETNRNKRELFDKYFETGDINIVKKEYTEPWGKIYNSNLIKLRDIYFDETIVANDVMFSLKASFFAESVKVIDRPIYVVTMRKDSVSYLSIDTMEKLLVRIDVTSRAQLFLQENGIYSNPMLVFDLMTNLIHRDFFKFVKQIVVLHRRGIPVCKLLYQIFTLRVLSPKNRRHVNVVESPYKRKANE